MQSERRLIVVELDEGGQLASHRSSLISTIPFFHAVLDHTDATEEQV